MRLLFLLLAVVAVLVGVGVTHIQRYESSYLLVTPQSTVDFIGMAKEQWNALTRDCTAVNLDAGNSEQYKKVERYLNSNPEGGPGGGKAVVLTTAAQEGWYLAEVEFETLEPALLLLREEAGGYTWVQEATWSGVAGPWLAGPVIREFMSSKAPLAPKPLLQCFKPTLAHFAG